MPGSGQHRINALQLIQSQQNAVIPDTIKKLEIIILTVNYPCLVACKGCILSPCIVYYTNIQAVLVAISTQTR